MSKIHKPKRKIVYNARTLERVEIYRECLLQNKTKKEIMEAIGTKQERMYYRIIEAYKDLYHSKEHKEQRLNEILEKISLLERQTFKDYQAGKLKPKDYKEILEFYIAQLTRYGLAPEVVEKLKIEHTGEIQTNLVAHFKEIEKALLKEKERLDQEDAKK